MKRPGFTILDELGCCFQLLARTTVDLGGDLAELDSNVSSVAIQHRCITVADLTRVVHDDNLQRTANLFSWHFDKNIVLERWQAISEDKHQDNQSIQPEHLGNEAFDLLSGVVLRV